MASNPSWTQETSALDVARTYSSQVSGKVVLITGVSPGGIGEATAHAFAHGGAPIVIITGRNDEKLSEVIGSLSKEYPKTRFRPLKLDMNSLQAVRKAAQEILNDNSIPQLDIVVANAGGNFNGPRTETVDGIETHFGVNHLAHFHFVTLLLPKLRAAAKKNPLGATRVVVLSSAAMLSSGIRFSDWQVEGKLVPDDEKPNWGLVSAILGVQPTDGYQHDIAYGQSKTANTLFALHLNELLASQGIYSFSVHPGIVNSTGGNEVWKTLSEEQKKALASFGISKSIDQGSSTTLVAALDPGLKPEAGVYLADCQVAEAPEWATDKAKAEKLWKLSEELVGEKVKL